jgi:mono/diheme cytochrome c family protein
MTKRTEPWDSRSTISRLAHVLERTGLAVTGASCGLFVAAHVGRADIGLMGSVVTVLAISATVAFAQNIENGRRLSERWCSQCHAIGPAPAKFDRAQSFASIAAKDKITTEMIASFLRLPHATMPNVPLSRKDAQDIAAFIMDIKK